MPNKVILYKSATPMKLNRITNAGNKKNNSMIFAITPLGDRGKLL